MPDPDHILVALREILADRFDIAAENVTPASLLRDLGLDSMMVMDVMLETEDRFGVKMMDLALPKEPAMSDVVALIQRNLGAAG